MTDEANKTSAWLNDPDRLAEGFLSMRYLYDPEPDNPNITEKTLSAAGYSLRVWRDEFYHYENGKYVKVSDPEMKANIKRHLHNLNAAAPPGTGATTNITTQRVNNIILCIKGMDGVHLPESRELNTWDDGRERVGIQTISFENGLLCIEKNGLTLVDHTPRYFSIVRLPYRYDPDAKCPRIEDFLYDILDGDMERIELIQQWCGYLYTPNLRAQKFLLCAGEGANGKGVLFELIERMLGRENCSHVPLCAFGDQFVLVQTLGKVVNSTSESNSTITRYAEGTLKNFTAGDAMSFQRKFRDPIEAVPTAKVQIATNALPRFHDKTHGVWRRLLFIPFDKVIPEDEQNPNFADELSAELPGFFNFALDGMRSFAEKGFVKPLKCQNAVEDYKRMANPCRAFLQDNFEVLNHNPLLAQGAGAGTTCDDAYKYYTQWCSRNGHRPTNSPNFGKDLKRILPDVEKIRTTIGDKRVNLYAGLYPKPDSEITKHDFWSNDV